MSNSRNEKRSYDAAMLFWRLITLIFFREVRSRGASTIPREGPVIFAGAPHSNQFLDLLLGLEVYKETRRRVQFLTAAKSMKRKWVGFFARAMDGVPVTRAADLAKPGVGRIYLSLDDPCLVHGSCTKFTSDFAPRMQIMLPKSVNSVAAEVTEVISDTQLRIKKEFSGDSGSGTEQIREKVANLNAAGIDGLEFKKMPYVDQQELYDNVYECLKPNGSVGIFPEGGSHDRTDLLPLKAGVSIMALNAMAKDPNLKVKIVPVGLSYFHAHKFRSRAVLEFGSPLDVPPEYVEMYKRGGTEKREAISKLLDLIYGALKVVTVRAPDYETLMLVQAVRRLYQPPGAHLSLHQVMELNRRLLKGYDQFKDKPMVQKLSGDVLKYNRLLQSLGVRDHQVPRARKASWQTLALLLYRVFLLLLWTILSLPGTVLNGPVFILGSVISRRKAKEALAASSVKISGRDVLASWKVLIALAVTPILYAFYAILATVIAARAQAPLKWTLSMPFLVLVALPVMNLAALKFGEAGMDVLKSLPPLIIALAPGQQRSLGNLKAMRVQLAGEVNKLIDTLGPELYDDFEESRILSRSTSAQPSGDGTSVLRPRTGGATGKTESVY